MRLLSQELLSYLVYKLMAHDGLKQYNSNLFAKKQAVVGQGHQSLFSSINTFNHITAHVTNHADKLKCNLRKSKLFFSIYISCPT